MLLSQASFQVATFVCADTREDDAWVDYPLLGPQTPDERRLSYWRLAVTLMLSARRIWPNKDLIVYTNDEAETRIGEHDARALLAENGVSVEYLPFDHFKLPYGLGRRFANCFYRWEALPRLARAPLPTLLLDSDCLVIRPSEWLNEQITSPDSLTGLDIYHRADRPQATKPHGISVENMGDLFRQIEPDYPVSLPVWYGRELLAGSPENLELLADRLRELYDRLLYQMKRGAAQPSFSNGTELFSSDEYLWSMAVNEQKVVDASPVAKRIFALPTYSNAIRTDLNLAIWHLPGEKNTGLADIYNLAADSTSNFWKCSLEDFPALLGSLVGIDGRMGSGSGVEGALRTLFHKVRGSMGNVVRNF